MRNYVISLGYNTTNISAWSTYFGTHANVIEAMEAAYRQAGEDRYWSLSQPIYSEPAEINTDEALFVLSKEENEIVKDALLNNFNRIKCEIKCTDPESVEDIAELENHKNRILELVSKL